MNDYSSKAQLYAAGEIEGTGYLAFRDIIQFIPANLSNFKALDFGCGAGRSTRFLKKIHGIDTIGVDISEAMLKEAIKKDPSGNYVLIDESLPFVNDKFHIILSTLVLFEIPSLEKMANILAEVNRVLHKDGVAIFVTGSEKMYSHHWLSIQPLTNKKNFSSGEPIEIKLRGNIILTDYFWTNKDYKSVFKKTNFECLKVHYPKGKKEEFNWNSELHHSPYVLYVLKKVNERA